MKRFSCILAVLLLPRLFLYGLISWIDWGKCTTPPATAPSNFMRKWLPNFHNSPQNLSLQYNKHEQQSTFQHQRCSQTDHGDQYLEAGGVCIFRLHSSMTRLWRKGAVIRHVEKNRLKIVSPTCGSKIPIWGSFPKWLRRVCEVRKIAYMSKLVVFSRIQWDWGMSPPQNICLGYLSLLRGAPLSLGTCPVLLVR